jgi:hypothetical protein
MTPTRASSPLTPSIRAGEPADEAAVVGAAGEADALRSGLGSVEKPGGRPVQVGASHRISALDVA